jgi:flavin-dependent dehydrogenase
MNMPSVNKIVIVGGGSAGWMTAATLKHHLPEKDISVIESPNIPTVGVGESTIGQINAWLHDLDIKDDDWMKYCDASYKLSIKFTDFYKENSGGFHYPFGQPHTEGNIFGINDWYFKKAKFPETPNSDYAYTYYPATIMSEANKITENKDRKIPTWRFDNDTAYHFDAAKFGAWMRDQYCVPRGVTHIKAEVEEVDVDDNGVNYLQLDNGDRVTADLYIDCTGFKAILIDKCLKVPFKSFNDILPNNSAWATRLPYQDKAVELQPYTNCTAIENGWVWNIPLWSRTGTGYVYSDKFVSDEEALEQFKNYLRVRKPVAVPDEIINSLEFKNIKMRVGIHEETYVKNVCAIGLAAGFIEPLESNGLFTVHEFLTKLAKTLRRESISQWDKDCYNASCYREFNGFAQFVALHYALSQRSETEYWRTNNDKKFYPDLIQKMNTNSGFENFMYARMHKNEYNLDTGGISAIAAGMGFFPIDESSIKRAMFTNAFVELLNLMEGTYDKWEKEQREWREIIDSAPTLYEYLKAKYNDE